MKLVNLTPHPVVFYAAGSPIAAIAPSGGSAVRCASRTIPWGIVDVEVTGPSLPLVRVVGGEVEGLPEPEPGTMYLVSRVAAEAIYRTLHRSDDIVFPERFVRDPTGAIIGCEALGRF